MTSPTTNTMIAEKGLIRVVIVCKCGMKITLRVKPGEVVCLTCPRCGQTLTAVVPMRGD